MAVVAPPKQSSEGKPRIACFPRVSASKGQAAIELARKAGLNLDEHQCFVLEKSLGTKRDRWVSFEVGINEPRQNGKDAILEARELAGLYEFEEELLVHSAHEFATSQEHFRRVEGLIRGTPDLLDQVKRTDNGRVCGFKHSHGEESIELHDGRRILFRTRTAGGMRGFSGDFIALNEAMILKESSMGAMMPTLRARANKTPHGVQVWYAGSAVDQEIHEHGVVWSRVRERGIAGEKGLAYFEWSAPLESPYELDEEMMYDELLRKATNPAYGMRISSDHFDRECKMLDRRTVAVELFGVGDWPATDPSAQGPITIDEWLELADNESQLQDPVCLAFDVSPDRTASIAAAGPNQNGDWHVEIGENRSGTSWLPKRLSELVEHFDSFVVKAASSSPAMSAVREVEEAGVKVEVVSVDEHAQACGRLVDAIAMKQLRHLGSAELADAIRGAATRTLGDSWLWSRKSSAIDISPLVAATLALDGAMSMPEGEFYIV